MKSDSIAQSDMEADMTVKIARDEMSAQDLRAQAGRVRDGKVARRLLAIALVLEGASRKRAAESCGLDRQTLRDWVHRYNAEGVGGLANRVGGGARPRLTPDQMAQLAAWVEAGPDPARDGVVRWRRADPARRIEAEFGVRLHQRTVGKHLARLGFRRLSVRPEHPDADPAAQEAFKKTSRAS
jgi:putative transposase